MDINLGDTVIYKDGLGLKMLTKIIAVDPNDGSVAIPSLGFGYTPNDMGFMIPKENFIKMDIEIMYHWVSLLDVEVYNGKEEFDIDFYKIVVDRMKKIC